VIDLTPVFGARRSSCWIDGIRAIAGSSANVIDLTPDWSLAPRPWRFAGICATGM